MSVRTSQLQIRVTPAEKSVLKRLAGAAGETVSAYVLSRVLPSAELELDELFERLSSGGPDVRTALSELAGALARLPAEDLASTVPEPRPDVLHPVLVNRVAALVESVAHAKGVAPPNWTRRVSPLERPFFEWSLSSLKPHQMRVAPVAFKRRNVYVDPAVLPGRRAPDPGSAPGSPDVDLFMALDGILRTRDTEVEFYFLGGAVLQQAFSSDPGTANLTALFQSSGPLESAVREVAGDREVSESWPHDAVRGLLATAHLASSPRWLELPNVRVFEPLPDYVLAVKCAAMRLGGTDRDEEDLRYVLRAMNVRSVDRALGIISRYFAEHQLVPDIRTRVRALLPS